jgi:predicted lipid-binding transport protein (Tim44 family)
MGYLEDKTLPTTNFLASSRAVHSRNTAPRATDAQPIAHPRHSSEYTCRGFEGMSGGLLSDLAHSCHSL